MVIGVTSGLWVKCTFRRKCLTYFIGNLFGTNLNSGTVRIPVAAAYSRGLGNDTQSTDPVLMPCDTSVRPAYPHSSGSSGKTLVTVRIAQNTQVISRARPICGGINRKAFSGGTKHSGYNQSKADEWIELTIKSCSLKNTQVITRARPICDDVNKLSP